MVCSVVILVGWVGGGAKCKVCSGTIWDNRQHSSTVAYMEGCSFSCIKSHKSHEIVVHIVTISTTIC